MAIRELFRERAALLRADEDTFDAARLADIDDELIAAIPSLPEEIESPQSGRDNFLLKRLLETKPEPKKKRLRKKRQTRTRSKES